eukprot:4134651-Prymnesium_polylepis.2
MPTLLKRRDGLRSEDRDLESLMREIVPDVALAEGDGEGESVEPVASASDGATAAHQPETEQSLQCILDFLLFRDVVQDHTADLRQTSARCYDTDYYGGMGRDELMPGGYDCIVRGLAAGLDIRTGRSGEVRAIRWNGGRVVDVTTADGKVHTADRVIVTVPLGVLKAALLGRTPPRPNDAAEAPPRGSI